MSGDVQLNVTDCEDVEITVDDCEELVSLTVTDSQSTVGLTISSCEQVELTVDDCEENIELTVLESGVVIVSPPPNNIHEAQNQEATATIYPGQPVAVHSSGVGYVLANNDGPITNTAFAIAITQAAPGFPVIVQKDGIINVADWTPVIGFPTFPPLSRWFLGKNGQLTQVSPTTPGEYSQNIGESCGSNCLGLNIAKPVRRN